MNSGTTECEPCGPLGLNPVWILPVFLSTGPEHQHGRQGPPLERTRPFVVVDGHQKTLNEALQVRLTQRYQYLDCISST